MIEKLKKIAVEAFFFRTIPKYGTKENLTLFPC